MGELNILILCRCAARQSWPVCSLNSATAFRNNKIFKNRWKYVNVKCTIKSLKMLIKFICSKSNSSVFVSTVSD